VVDRQALGYFSLALVFACEGKPKAIPTAHAALRAASTGSASASPSDGPHTTLAKAPPSANTIVEPSPSAAPIAPSAPIAASIVDPANSPASSRCKLQTAQAFLIAAHFDSHHALGLERQREWASVLSAAVRYRTEHYGYVEGFGKKSWNQRTPFEQVRSVTFFGVPVRIHERIAGVLECVETEIRARCADHPYQPAVLSGARKRNTYLNGEVSNHVYGIALDIDPMRNPCCGCVEPWRSNPRCQNEKSKFERMEMPKCWVEQFERFGFYWLGHDRIEDTMHFEFLADPSQISG
jgi:hypothetical protein